MEVNSILLDTNILVYHVSGDPMATKLVDKSVANGCFCVSILSVIEFLGWQGHSNEKFAECRELVGLAKVFPVSAEVADKAVELRRLKKIKLADAIIAATALVNSLSLVTRNVRDFKGITNLNLINPFVEK